MSTKLSILVVALVYAFFNAAPSAAQPVRLKQQVRDVIARDILRGVICPYVASSQAGTGTKVEVTPNGEGCKSGLFGTDSGTTLFIGEVGDATHCLGVPSCVVEYRVMCIWVGLINASSCDDYGPAGMLVYAMVKFNGEVPETASVHRK